MRSRYRIVPFGTIGLVLPLLLGGCGTFVEGRDKTFTKGAQFNDEALNTAVLWKCRAASIGSVERRYMRSQDTWEIWVNECLSDGAPEIPELDEAEVEVLPRPE